MNIKKMLAIYKFHHNLKIARKKFFKAITSSIYNDMGKHDRRQLLKELLRGIGYKHIRMIERNNVMGKNQKREYENAEKERGSTASDGNVSSNRIT